MIGTINVKFKHLLYLIVVILLGSSSCKKEELILTTDVIDIHLINSLSEIKEISITSNQEWRIHISDNWLRVSKSIGEGNQTISVNPVSLNDHNTERTATITIMSGSEENRMSVNIVVTQGTSVLEIEDKKELYEFSFAGTEHILKVKANCDWRINISGQEKANIRVIPLEGTGDSDISITCNADDIRKDETFDIELVSAKIVVKTSAIVYGLPNTKPNDPVLITPEIDQEINPIDGVLSWECDDPDGDNLSYTVLLSEDGVDWVEKEVGDRTTMLAVDLELDEFKSYQWKVKADDKNEKENSVSYSTTVGSFTTSKLNYEFENGVAQIYYQSPRAKSVKIVFTGDGYTAPDFMTEGKFGMDIKEGIEAFFSVEPYKTYKDYFTIYILPAFSKESGVTIISTNQKRETVFKTEIQGGGKTSMTCDSDAVFNAVKEGIGVTDNDLNNMSIVLLANENIYAGTCRIWSTGRSIALCPVSRDARPGTIVKQFHNIIAHEAGGHGWGRLTDEYINSTTTITSEEKEKLTTWQGYGYGLNVSLSSDPLRVPWKEFIGMNEYPRVGLYEGGYLFKYGVWRSEETNCMINNILYYAAWCRYIQVKRIMDVVGEDFNLQKFLERDVQAYPSAIEIMMMTKAEKELPPLHPPVLIED